MDELTQYLKSNKCYTKLKLEQILNKKIIITKNHIGNIDLEYHNLFDFNIIKLFEKYGYCFTNDDYILLVGRRGAIIKDMSDAKKTDAICKIAISRYWYAIKYIPEDKKTIEMCKIAVLYDGQLLEYVPNDKKTDKICEIAVGQTIHALRFVPDNKKYLFIKK